jgi:hypothetical protein
MGRYFLPIGYWLLFIVVDLYPVAVGVFEIDLFHPVYPVGDRVFFTGPVFVFNAVLFKVSGEAVHVGHAEAQVGVFVVGCFGSGAGDHVQVAMSAYAEPGVFTIVKRFGNGIEPNDVLVKMGACF